MKKVKNLSYSQWYDTGLRYPPRDYRYFPIEYPTNIFTITMTDAIEGYHTSKDDDFYSVYLDSVDKSKFLLLPKGDPNNHFADIISIGH